MNAAVTSKEAILAVCRRMVAQQGLSSINMRAVAKECGVASGTLYHYFADKDELLLFTVESIWKDIFHVTDACETALPFPEYLARLFDCAKQGAAQYPNFLIAHSMIVAQSKKAEARIAMERCLAHVKAGMLASLRADPAVNPKAFSPTFTALDLTEFVLDHIVLLMMKQSADCKALVAMVRQAIYR